MKLPHTITALPVLATLGAVYLAAILVPDVRRRAHLTRRRLITATLLAAYGLAVVAATIFPIKRRPPDFWQEPWWTMFHPVPFYVDAPSMVLNVIMFVPFGVLVPLLWPSVDSYRRIALTAVRVSFTIEVVQLVIGLTLGSRRTVDVNDLMANTAGAVLGLLVLRLTMTSGARRAQVGAW